MHYMPQQWLVMHVLPKSSAWSHSVPSSDFFGLSLLFYPPSFWAAWYVTRLLVKLTPKGVVFCFLFFVSCVPFHPRQGLGHYACCQLICLCACRCAEIARFALLCMPPQGRTPLHRAVAAGHVEIAKLFISKQELPGAWYALQRVFAIPVGNACNCLQPSLGLAQALGAGGRVHGCAVCD